MADDAPFQFVEGEYVREDEYDEFLTDPDGFTLTRIFPRIADKLAGFGHIPFPPPLDLDLLQPHPPGGLLEGMPEMRKALEALLELADVVEEEGAIIDHVQDMADLGYPLVNGSGVIPAFDTVSDFFRGLKGSSLDIYRNPEQLKRATDLMQPACIAMCHGGGQGKRQSPGVHPHAPRSRRLHERGRLRGVLLADVQGASSRPWSTPGSPPSPCSRATTPPGSSTWPNSRPARSPATSTMWTARSSRRSAAT